MAQSAADRNLLFGILALQMDFITRDGLVAAMNAWLLQKDRPLADLLEESGALEPGARALLEPLVRHHIERHGGDPSRSLASLSSVDWIRADLAPIGEADAEVHHSLTRLGPAKTDPGGDPEATARYSRPAGSTDTRFRIIRFHARGGLGDVFVADDAQLSREVALKRIQDRHGDQPESRARFLLEAEITGGLEHPGIVPVYGLGHYADGRPYYAMRFIKGDSLREAIKRFHAPGATGRGPGERTLELQKLLRRFLDVCNAIAYAHSRGVLHRDIKPGNIMVGQYGETLVVDWGLAKVVGTSASSAEATLRPPSASGSSETLPGSAIGTPGFMSPEQAAGWIDLLGPASDVYSLGATLYCLLTGKAPIEGTDFEEMLRQVQRGEVIPPRQVQPDVPRPLEAICMKAMALRTEDRYSAPRDLAEDIERWLADESVMAYREPRIARIARWGRQHKTLVTAVVAAVLVAAVSFGAATALLLAANDRERKLTGLAQRNGETAQSNFRLAFDGVDRYFTQVSEDRLLNVPGLQPVRRQLLDTAREFYEKLVDEKHDDPTIQAELGRAYLRLARITFESDTTAKPIDLAQKGLAILRPLMDSRPSDDKLRNDVASGLGALGYMHGSRREIDLAERNYRESIKLWESLAHDRPDQPQYPRDVAKALTSLGNFYSSHERTADARVALLSARSTARDFVKAHPADVDGREALQEAEFYLGTFFSHVGEINAAESAIRASFEAIDEPARQRPRDLRLQFKRSATLTLLAEHLGKVGRLDESEKTFVEAASGLEKLVRENPTVVIYRRALFRTHIYRGERCEATGQREAAERHCGAALKIAEELVRDNPDVPDLQNDMAVALSGLFNVYYGAGRMEEAAAANRRAAEIREKIAREHPQVPHFQDVRAQTGHNQALQSAPAADQGIGKIRETIEAHRTLVRDHPDVVKFRFSLAWDLNTLGGLSHRGGRYVEAEAAFREAIAEWRELVRREPEVPDLKHQLGKSLSNLGGILTIRSQFELARPIQIEAIELNGGLVRDHPVVIDYLVSLSAAEDNLASIAREAKDFRKARDGYDRSIRALEDVLRRDPPNRQAKEFLVTTRTNRAVLMIQEGDHRGALNELDLLAGEPANPGQRYNLGCAFSLLSAAAASDAGLPERERTALADAHAVRAIKLLGQSAAADRFRPSTAILAHMKNDSDLNPIRSRKDYQELIKRIEAQAIGTGAEQKTISPAR